jgi:hypothetical protein
MKNNTATDCHDGNEPKRRLPIGDHVNYRSSDGAVEILTKVSSARRFPQHSYPIVCIRLHPKKGTRIQQLEDSEGLEILLSHVEVVQHLSALNAADPKANYAWTDVPEKPAARKAYWDKVIQERLRKLNAGEE